jgi:hypothetical protein
MFRSSLIDEIKNLPVEQLEIGFDGRLYLYTTRELVADEDIQEGACVRLTTECGVIRGTKHKYPFMISKSSAKKNCIIKIEFRLYKATERREKKKKKIGIIPVNNTKYIRIRD